MAVEQVALQQHLLVGEDDDCVAAHVPRNVLDLGPLLGQARFQALQISLPRRHEVKLLAGLGVDQLGLRRLRPHQLGVGKRLKKAF